MISDAGMNDFYDSKQKVFLSNFADEFSTDVRKLAEMYVEHFFKDKMLHSGGRIPKKCLTAEERIDVVLNLDISSGVQKAYQHMCAFDVVDHGEIPTDIKLVLDVLRLLSKSGVPQQFAGGMMLLYLEFIEGVQISYGS